MVSTVKPLGNRVLVKRSEVEKTQGGIILHDSAKEKPKQGVVMAVGPGKDASSQEMEVKVGDKVFFSSYAGSEVVINGDEDFLILSVDDILCVAS